MTGKTLTDVEFRASGLYIDKFLADWATKLL